jgi:tricorn protease
MDPWASFMGLANQKVKITVGPNPNIDSQSRTYEVQTLGRESDLRQRDWVERNRQYVDRLSSGKLGYIYLPDEGQAGNAEFAKQFYAQMDKQGVVVDVRWNTGGTSSDRMIEMLNRPLLNSITERYTMESFTVPGNRIPGPKCLLINRVTSSSGENFAYYFRKAGLGKLIGTRTWGGLIGVNGNQNLIDGGYWWIPQSAFFIDEKNWMPEGIGIEPDITVMDDPALMRHGEDPQLEAAVRHLLSELKSRGEPTPIPPPVGKRSDGS